MDPQQYHHYEETSNNNAMASKVACRQSSSRWIPTEKHVRMLRDLYYNCGVRSPSAEQIQKISSQLCQYGKIQGKNVFYWFQNHQARERQKKRVTVETTTKIPTATTTNSNNISHVAAGVSAGPCSAGLYGTFGQMGSNGYGGSMLMESNFGESCVYGAGCNVAAPENSKGWVGFESSPAAAWIRYNFLKNEPSPAPTPRKIDTLPLFPVHSHDNKDEQDHPATTRATNVSYPWKTYQPNDYFPDFEDGHQHLNGGVAASLELSLSSLYYAPPVVIHGQGSDPVRW